MVFSKPTADAGVDFLCLLGRRSATGSNRPDGLIGKNKGCHLVGLQASHSLAGGHGLQPSQGVLEEGGRGVVLAYHSLEDRRVKRFFRDGKFRGDAERDAYGNRLTPFKPLTRKAETASDDEVAANPFLRADRPELRAAAGLGPGADDAAVFAALRRMKDRF